MEMPREPYGKPLSLGTPAAYRIVVQGVLEKRFADRLGSMEITMGRESASTPVTTLVGRLRDQAQLIGVVNALYELRLPILVVERVESPEGPTSSESITP